MKTEILELDSNCKLECSVWEGGEPSIELSYIEHQGDYFSAYNSETTVEITREKALEIVTFLKTAYNI